MNDTIFVAHYEDLFFDKARLLVDVASHINYPLEDKIVTEVSKRHDIRPLYEDPTKHIRRGFPGDYLNKLETATVKKVTSMFEDVMGDFGYALQDC